VLRTRLLTAIILIPIVAGFIYLGDLPYLALIAVLTTLAEVELLVLIAHRGFQPVHIFGIGLVWICLLDSKFPQGELLRFGLVSLLLASLSWQVLRYQRSAVRDWTATVASGLYVGLCGSCLVRLRALPGDGLWWTLIVVPVTLLADSTAYTVGSLWGKRKLAPLLSSGKTWEGYASGVAAGALMGGFLGWIWSLKASLESAVSWPHGLVLGLLIAVVAPMGDLAISMVKREAGVKHSGRLLPGHGGVLDRIDSILYAAVISHIYVTWIVD
jgi:phosphatidate cytidylyltransferase